MVAINPSLENIELREVHIRSENPQDVRFAIQAEDLLKGPADTVDWETDRVFAAIGNGALIGAANATMGVGDEAYIYGIITAEDARRKGVGTVLMQHIIDVATAAGHNSIQLSPERETLDNQPRLFFEKLGFVPMLPSDSDFYEGRMILRLPKE